MMKEDKPTPPAAAEAAVPEASPEGNEKSTTKKSAASRRNLYIGLGVLFVVMVALCIALPLTLIDNDSSDKEMSQAESGVTMDNDDKTTEGGGRDGLTSKQMNDDDEGAAGTSDGSDGTSVFVNEDATLPLFGREITNGYQTTLELETALQIAFRKQALSIIEQNVQQMQNWKEYQHGYPRENEIYMEEQMEDGDAGGEPVPAAAPMGGETANMMAADSSLAGTSGAATMDEGVTDFETNNQEQDVDEADMIKADENFVYAAYGDYIVIWDTDGNRVGQVKMPPIDLPDDWGKTIPPVEDAPEEEFVAAEKSIIMEEIEAYIPKPRISSMLLTDDHLVAMVEGYNNDYNHWWGHGDTDEEEKELHVLYNYRALQVRLYEKTPSGNLTFVSSKDVNGHYVDARSIGDVVHLATGSGIDYWAFLGHPLDWWQMANGTTDNLTTEEYRTAALAKIEDIVPTMASKLVTELTSDDGQLPTLLQVNQWFTVANDTGAGFDIPAHETYDVVSNMAQVTSFNVNEQLGEELVTSASAYLAPSYFSTLYGTQDHLVLATSGWDFNPIEGESEQTTYLVALEIDGASTSFLSVGTLKGHLLNQYALDIVDNELRAATTVERFSWWWGGGGPFFPMPFDAVAETAAVEVEPAQASDASVIDPNGLCPLLESDPSCLNENNTQYCLDLVAAGCEVVSVKESCPLQFSCNTNGMDSDSLCPLPDGEGGCISELKYLECLGLVAEGCGSIAVLESCPVQFECQPPDDVFIEPPPPTLDPEESRTENYMIVMKLVGENVPPGQMEEKGRVQIGERNERITAVRFFDNVAYAVTFEQTDPFYVLDMSVPEVLGELKIPGFSSYLHSMNADNTLLLAVGQNATETGMTTGLMVTVFDATDPYEPKAVVSHTFTDGENSHSSSSVQWDYKAFRYVDGKLVVPLEIYYYQEWNETTQEVEPLPEGLENFNGFSVLDVNTTDITEAYRISHMKDEGACHYCEGYLPRRSFVYSGDLMTIQDNIVVSTGLHSGEEQWRFNITIEGEKATCCW